MTGSRPYDDVEDDDEIVKRYGSKTFPPLHGIKCGDIIYKCWTQSYGNANKVLDDVKQHVSSGYINHIWVIC
jgi:hypothetical protein